MIFSISSKEEELRITFLSLSILLSDWRISSNAGLSFGSTFQHFVIISYLIENRNRIPQDTIHSLPNFIKILRNSYYLNEIWLQVCCKLNNWAGGGGRGGLFMVYQ